MSPPRNDPTRPDDECPPQLPQDRFLHDEEEEDRSGHPDGDVRQADSKIVEPHGETPSSRLLSKLIENLYRCKAHVGRGRALEALVRCKAVCHGIHHDVDCSIPLKSSNPGTPGGLQRLHVHLREADIIVVVRRLAGEVRIRRKRRAPESAVDVRIRLDEPPDLVSRRRRRSPGRSVGEERVQRSRARRKPESRRLRRSS